MWVYFPWIQTNTRGRGPPICPWSVSITQSGYDVSITSLSQVRGAAGGPTTVRRCCCTVTPVCINTCLSTTEPNRQKTDLFLTVSLIRSWHQRGTSFCSISMREASICFIFPFNNLYISVAQLLLVCCNHFRYMLQCSSFNKAWPQYIWMDQNLWWHCNQIFSVCFLIKI